MSTPAARAEELKILLRALLISSPHFITVNQLESDFIQVEGHGVPFRELGYPSFMKYLESIPDTFAIHPSEYGGCPTVVAVNAEKSAHIMVMVQKKKFHPPKRGSGIELPAHFRSSVNATPQMSSAYCSNNYNDLKMSPDSGSPTNHKDTYTSDLASDLVSKKMKMNFQTLLDKYPNGICCSELPSLYKEEFLTTLNVHELGFGSLESFLLVLQQSNMLHVRCVKSKILVYPASNETEQEEANPFPHIMEPQDHFLNSYLPEVVGPKGTLTHEKIPPEATPGRCIEMLVVEVYTPLKFWIHLTGAKTHIVLKALTEVMNQFYLQEADNYNMPDPTIIIGQYCVALYNKKWHRACITEVDNLVEVQVTFVDYGSTRRLHRSELRFLHTKFAQFPIQAIEASLANLVPVGGGKKWPFVSCVRFLELVEEKHLIATISTVDHEARKLEISLADTTNENYDVHINDVLVYEGHAEYRTKGGASPLPPQLKRIDGDPASPAVTVSRPPASFTALSELHKQPLLSPTGSVAPGQSKYFPAMSGSSHLQTSLPNVPMANTTLSESTYVPETQGQSHLPFPLPNLPVANTIQSNLIPQPTNVPMSPGMYVVPLLANLSSLAAQSALFQNLVLYNNLVQREQLFRYYTLLLSQTVGAASLVNPSMVPELNPPVMYIPTPVSEGIANVGRTELGISGTPSCTLPSQKNALGQISPSGTGQLAAASYASASAPATFDTHAETKEPESVVSSGVSHLSVIVNSSTDLSPADVLCDEQLTVETIASPKEMKGVSPVQNEQQQHTDEPVQKALSNTALIDFSSGCYQPDDMLVVDSHGLESESHVDFESQYVSGATGLSSSSEYVYRSYNEDDDDDDGGEGSCEQQEQLTLRKSVYVKQIEIAGRVIHLVRIKSTVFFCTEEVVKYFTDFSARHVMLKKMDSMGIEIKVHEIERVYSRDIIEDLETYTILGVPKSPKGYIIGKVHLTPVNQFIHLVQFLNEEYKLEFCRVMVKVTW